MDSKHQHISVMLNQLVDALNIKDDGIYVDATLGRAGHSKLILQKLKTGKLISFDKDMTAIKYSEKILASISNQFQIVKSDFADLKSELLELNINKIDGIIYDLGVSSPQLDNAQRGFSFHNDGPLDMRMDQDQVKTAADIINFHSYEEIRNILFRYGDEKIAPKIARAIISARALKPITSTIELVDIIKSVYPAKLARKKHPARKSFQAIRIAVNDELNAINASIMSASEMLNSGGRICVISFHSGEDRIVKKIFNSLTKSKLPPNLPIKFDDSAPFITISAKKVLNSEVEQNLRSRSAKLRIIEKR